MWAGLLAAQPTGPGPLVYLRRLRRRRRLSQPLRSLGGRCETGEGGWVGARVGAGGRCGARGNAEEGFAKIGPRCLLHHFFGVCMSFYNMLRYYCTDQTTKGLCLLERAKVFTIPPLLVQTISLGYEVLPPPSIARHAGSRSVSVSTMVVLRCLISFPCCGSGVVSPF